MTSERERRELDTAIRRVVQRNACIGCGLCTRLDTSLRLELDADGFLRPHRTGADGVVADDARRRFEQACPGCRVAAVRPRGSRRHPTMGSYFGVWEAWANEEAVRWRGSSGGALTALHGWLLDSGRSSRIAVGGRRPRTPTHCSGHDHDEGGGARRGGLAICPGRHTRRTRPRLEPRRSPPSRARSRRSGRSGPPRDRRRQPRPTPPRLIRSSSRSSAPARRRSARPMSSSRCSAWDPTSPSTTSGTAAAAGPAASRVRRADGDASLSYEESWGGVLGPATHWRCKVCADGVGESADVVAADFWRVDERGYPVFIEGPGSSALIARTRRGLDAVLAAEAAGALVLRPIRMSELANVQPLQRKRRTSLFGRLLGSRLAGVPGPRYRGFRLWAFAVAHPRLNLRAARGAHDRIRRSHP